MSYINSSEFPILVLVLSKLNNGTLVEKPNRALANDSSSLRDFLKRVRKCVSDRTVVEAATIGKSLDADGKALSSLPVKNQIAYKWQHYTLLHKTFSA